MKRRTDLEGAIAAVNDCLARLDALQLHLEGAYVDLALQSLIERLAAGPEIARPERALLH